MYQISSLILGTILNQESLLEFAKEGTFLEFDLFGIETSYYQQNEEIYIPSDGQRIQTIQMLLQEGYEDRILVSHDLHTKHRLVCLHHLIRRAMLRELNF